ncbi:hypothetical protein GCM10018954_008200 [Kutzneria kofuensis]
MTLVLLAALGAVFLKGFTEAIGIAVTLVGAYLALNVVVVVVALVHVAQAPKLVLDWQSLLVGQYHNPWLMIGVALLVFPKLALGLSGFETGVAVMPQVRGVAGDTPGRPEGRIRNTRKLLTTAAVTMSVFLITTSFITSVLIPQQEFRSGGEANGRRWPISRTSTWAAPSAPSTTSAPSASCGSPARPRWPACSTSCPGTCPATAWRRTGCGRTGRWCWCSW